MSPKNARNAYISAAATTVSPSQLLVMLYEALIRNLSQAHGHIEANEMNAAHNCLLRSQEIVYELMASLDPEAFSAGPQLMGLYAWIQGELIDANVEKSKAKIMGVLSLVEPLAQTWRDAIEIIANEGDGQPSNMDAADMVV